MSKSLKDSKAEKTLEKLNSHNEKTSDLEKSISELKNKMLQIEEAENNVSEFLEDSEKFIYRLKSELEKIGITQGVIEKLEVVLRPENLKKVFKENREEIKEKIKKQEKKLIDINKNIKDTRKKSTSICSR